MVPLKTNTIGSRHVGIYGGIVSADGRLRSLIEGLEGEVPIKLYKKLWALACVPNFLRPVMGGLLWLLGERRASFMVLHCCFGRLLVPTLC